MMQKLFWIVLLIALAVVILFFFRGKASQTGHAAGLIEGKLTQCSSKPNCVCSEYVSDESHFIEPIDIGSMDATDLWAKVSMAIESNGGKIIDSSGTYLSATYTSKIFKFVDDVEARLDTQNNVIHLRSKSREGYSDLGANARRIAEIKKSIGL